jgi:hypothetical protein
MEKGKKGKKAKNARKFKISLVKRLSKRNLEKVGKKAKFCLFYPE